MFHKCAKLNAIINRNLIKEHDKYVMVYLRRNSIHCIRYFHFLKPDLIWKITEQWKSYSADEPSDWYIKSTKFGGALFTVFGIIIVILPFVLE